MPVLTLSQSIGLPVWLQYVGPSAVADLNGNGRPELVTGQFTVPGGEGLALTIFEFRPGGQLVDVSARLFRGPTPVVDFSRDLMIRDVNGDGAPDVLMADHGYDADPFPGAQNLLLLSDGRGHLVNATARLGGHVEFTHSMAVGDADGDGRTEVLWNNLGVDNARLQTIGRDGSVSAFSGGLPRMNQYVTATFAEMDGQRGDELILGVDQNIDPGGQNRIGSFQGGAWRFRDLPTVTRPEGVIVLDSLATDLDGDGLGDILFLYTSARPFYQGWGLQVLTQRADGSFADRTSDFLPLPAQTDRGGTWAPFLHLQDLNGDGRNDLVIARNFPGEHLLFFQNAKGRFVAQDVSFGTQDSVSLGDVTGDGRPDIVVTGSTFLNVYEVEQATRLDERVTGGARADRLYGGTGNDTLAGRGGADLILGGTQSDRILGGAGRDRLSGEAGMDTILGQGGGDRIDGGAQADRLLGGAGNDRIDGGTGRDLLNGQAGNDILTGGRGADVFVFSSGQDVITDFRSRQGDSLQLDASALGIDAATPLPRLLRQHASVTEDGVRLDFGSGKVLLLDGLQDVTGLADDIVLI